MTSRRELFEFNDSVWAPEVLRRTIIDALGRTVAWSRLLAGAAPAFIECLDRAGTAFVLDVCSGTGDAVMTLVEAAEKQGRPIRLTLSDLFPRKDRWKSLAASGRVEVIEAPLDVTSLPPGLATDRVVTICNSLHHFSPPAARAVLREVCAHAKGVFIVEALNPSPWSFAAMTPVGLAALLATPALSPNRSLLQMALTWGTPVVLAASVWDGVVSALRSYRPEELEALVSGLDGWRWTSGTFRHSMNAAQGTWFSGTRARG